MLARSGLLRAFAASPFDGLVEIRLDSRVEVNADDAQQVPGLVSQQSFVVHRRSEVAERRSQQVDDEETKHTDVCGRQEQIEHVPGRIRRVLVVKVQPGRKGQCRYY